MRNQLIILFLLGIISSARGYRLPSLKAQERSAVLRTTKQRVIARVGPLLAMATARRHIQSHTEVFVAYHQPAYGC